MRTSTAGLVSVFSGGMLVAAALPTRGDARPPAQGEHCGAASAAQLRTTLYFGLGRPSGMVSELEWQVFLRDEVTARFPAGLTVWDAEGQWLRSQGGIGHERTKVLLLVHPDTRAAQASVETVIAEYRKAFDQESVLWETARVCVASAAAASAP
ncbi:MAG TPA: DUF3574 domain-containing protein [Vicinamibacteria bacterium]|jgi:hypothetical protein